MSEEDILEVLKMDLQISADKMDKYLRSLIAISKSFIEEEGIRLEETIKDGMLTEMYAAYLYRKRRENVPLPRALRWALNNRLLSQKRK